MKPVRCLIGAVILSALAGSASAMDVAPPGAAACSGCHPANRSAGTPFTRLVGRSPSDIVMAMREFRTGKRPATVMDRIAKGFTDSEVEAIAKWYAAQKE
jgi:cytochrome c553